MLCFSNYSTKSKYCGNSNKLVIGKIKDETRGIAIEEFVGLKQKISWFLVDKSEHKKSKVVMKMLLQQYVIMDINMYYWIINVEDPHWIVFKVKTIVLEHTKSVKFHCLVLMTKYTLKTVDVIDLN